jgi:poly(3-hydroxybutyrate) depolymerase
MSKFHLIRNLLAAAILLGSAGANAADKLAPLHADPAKISISGLSSGGYMAVQYDVAFSGSTLGVGVVAGGPYNCAFVNLGGIATCLTGSPLGYASYSALIGFAALGQIDPFRNLAKGKVYLFSGTDDTVVHQSVMDAVRDFYTLASVPAANMVYVNNFAAGHAFVSPAFGNPCDKTEPPYINECAVAADELYDQPAALLTQIYGPLQPKATTLSAQPKPFSQAEFASAAAGLASTGYVYIPDSCQQASGRNCAVHVVFHGCKQGAGTVGDDVYAKVGYNAWADTNGIIVLYPQVDPTTFPLNPEGCWDWWGYTGLNFQTRSGPQLAAIRSMVKRLTVK